jgi:hypothetical protein
MRCFPYYLSAFVSQKRILIKIWLLTKGPVNWFFKRNEKEIPELTNIFLSIHTEIESDDWWITREGWTRESYFGSVILLSSKIEMSLQTNLSCSILYSFFYQSALPRI